MRIKFLKRPGFTTVILGVIILVSIIVGLADSDYKDASPSSSAQPTQTIESTSSAQVKSANDVSNSQEAQVIRVVDGDTVVVVLAGQKQKVRVIGINTPETIDPRKPVQCFGKQASAYANNLLFGQTVILEADPTQGNSDKYGRLLRYVWMKNGMEDYGADAIEQGYAYEYTYDTPYKYQSEYKNLQKQAAGAGRGLWADNTCGGNLSGINASASSSLLVH